MREGTPLIGADGLRSPFTLGVAPRRVRSLAVGRHHSGTRNDRHIHRSINRTKKGKKRETKPTKTKHPRRFALEPNLIPLLKVLKKPSGLVFEPLNNTEYSYRLRVFLKRAGVTRADLFTRDATRKQLTWHDTRATHATWSAVRGDPTSRIKFRIGHSRTDTTDIYVREGEQLRDGLEPSSLPYPIAFLQVNRPRNRPHLLWKITNSSFSAGILRPQRDTLNTEPHKSPVSCLILAIGPSTFGAPVGGAGPMRNH